MGPANAALGATAKSRLLWLLDFAQRDLESLDERQWAFTWRVLHRLYFGGAIGERDPGWGTPLTVKQRQIIEDIHYRLGGLLQDLAHGRSHACNVKVMYSAFAPPPRRSPGSRDAGRIRRDRVTSTVYFGARGLNLGDAISAAVLRTVDLLDEVGADRLRACWCGRLFLARGRRVHCSDRHARQAAWRAYISREGVAAARKLAR